MINANEFYNEMCRKFEEKSGYTVFEDSDVGIRFSAVAAAMSSALEMASALKDSNSIQKCSSEMLDLYATEYGLQRKAATKAVTTLSFKTVSFPLDEDITVAQGTLVCTKDGITFITDKTVFLGKTTYDATVTATAVDAGKVTLPPHTLTRFCSPVSPLVEVTNEQFVDSGSDAESDSQLRRRLLLIKNGFPCLTNKDYIRSLALQYEGVLDAAVTSTDGNTSIVLSVETPDTFDITAFKNYMFENLPLSLDLTVSFCKDHRLYLEVHLHNARYENCTDDMYSSIMEFFKTAEIGKIINNAELYDLIAQGNYCDSFEIMGLDYDFSIKKNEKYIVDDVLFFRY